MVERTQQLKYTSTLIAEEQKLSVSVHTESITERKKVMQFWCTPRWNVPGC